MLTKSLLACGIFAGLLPAGLLAGSGESRISIVGETIPDWVPSTRLSYLHQFDTGLDDGGSFSVNRAAFGLGVTRVFDREHTIGLTLGYGLDDYQFDDLSPAPWSDIHSLRLSAPIRWQLSDDWRLFAVPTLRSSAESGADFSDGLSGGVISGLSYTFGDHLTIGPGIGVLSQLEESTSVFPVLLIKWQLTDSLSFETGRGFGASQGPGLNFVWQASENLKFTLGGRYEKLRFRLDDSGPSPNGVGEDRGIPLYLGANYATGQFSELTAYIGARFGGSLTLDNDSGNRVSRSDYDPAFFAGIGWKWGS